MCTFPDGCLISLERQSPRMGGVENYAAVYATPYLPLDNEGERLADSIVLKFNQLKTFLIAQTQTRLDSEPSEVHIAACAYQLMSAINTPSVTVPYTSPSASCPRPQNL